MANNVWHTLLKLELDLSRGDLGHPHIPDLWDQLYRQDRLYAARRVPVAERGLQCAGVCRKAGVVAWMHLRLQSNGRRAAVHEKAEDEARHTAVMSDEHKAYQERIVTTAEEAGFAAATEVRTAVGPRSWIQTDTLVDNGNGIRIGWEVQLSNTDENGLRSVRSRARKAAKNGITPAWHTDREDFSRRNDTQWTRSTPLPARIIAAKKLGGIRVISGYRVLDFWRCDVRAVYQCPDGVRRCGKLHVTPRPKDVFFDDLVRDTAAGLIVPMEHGPAANPMRFWVPTDDRERYFDAFGAPDTEEAGNSGDIPEQRRSTAGNQEDPTCRANLERRARVVLQAGPPVVDWRSSSHWLLSPQPCRYCNKPAHLADEEGRPAHKVCHEEAAHKRVASTG